MCDKDGGSSRRGWGGWGVRVPLETKGMGGPPRTDGRGSTTAAGPRLLPPIVPIDSTVGLVGTAGRAQSTRGALRGRGRAATRSDCRPEAAREEGRPGPEQFATRSRSASTDAARATAPESGSAPELRARERARGSVHGNWGPAAATSLCFGVARVVLKEAFKSLVDLGFCCTDCPTSYDAA